MFRKSAFIYLSVFVLSYLLIGCGVRPQVDFYVNPVMGDEDQQIDEESGLVTAEEAGISITVSALDTVDLLSITSDAHLNPYIYVNDWGTARPRYVVFDVTIKNNRESEIRIEPSSAVLMDDTGEQYGAIPYRAFKERYGTYPGRISPGYSYRPYYGYGRARYRYDYSWYQRPYYARRVYDPGYIKGEILKGTMLRAVRLYPDGKRHGLMVFPLLPPDTGSLKLIIPGITIYREGKGKKVKFRFNFQRTPAVKNENDDKKDAGAG